MISFGLIVLRVIIYDFSTLMIILVIPFTITHSPRALDSVTAFALILSLE